MPKTIMTIVGFGPMGRRFTSLFAEEFDVRVSSSRDVKKEVETFGATVTTERGKSLSVSDYIFLAVPISALSDIVQEINDQAEEHAVVIDCCSARIPAEQQLARLKQHHFGIHDIKNGEFCVTGEMDSHMSEFFRDHDIALRRVSPEEHDRLNAILGLGHFVGLALGKFLTKQDKEILAGMGSGKKLLALVEHLAGNSPTTWQETQFDNQFTRERREELIQALSEYNRDLSQGLYPFG